jgi:hypothetical protein
MSDALRHVVAWFNRTDWEELKRLCPPGDLQDTYDEWVQNAEAGLKAQGLGPYDLEKVILTPDDLRNWLAENDGKIDGRVRSLLAIQIAANRKNTQH